MTVSSTLFLSWCLLGMALIGCSDPGVSAAEATPENPTRATRPASDMDPTTMGSVRVHVVFEGTPPPPRVVDTAADRACCKLRAGDLVEQRIVANAADGSLTNAFVLVRDGLDGWSFEVPSDPVLLDQRGCEFVPHVLGIRAGQTLRIHNDDATLHNVHARSRKNRAFNLGMPERGQESRAIFRKPETMIEVRCNVHEWMSAWIGVVDHPWFGVTGESGIVELPPLPPGDYAIEVWHEKLGTQKRTVTVEPRGATTVTFTFEG